VGLNQANKILYSERWILPYKLKKRIRNEGKEEGLKEGSLWIPD